MMSLLPSVLMPLSSGTVCLMIYFKVEIIKTFIFQTFSLITTSRIILTCWKLNIQIWKTGYTHRLRVQVQRQHGLKGNMEDVLTSWDLFWLACLNSRNNRDSSLTATDFLSNYCKLDFWLPVCMLYYLEFGCFVFQMPDMFSLCQNTEGVRRLLMRCTINLLFVCIPHVYFIYSFGNLFNGFNFLSPVYIYPVFCR